MEERERMAKEGTNVEADMRDACEEMAARQKPVPQEVHGTTKHPIQQDEREEEADGYEVDARGSDYMQKDEEMDNMAPPQSTKKTKI
jgi:hypothetical protein